MPTTAWQLARVEAMNPFGAVVFATTTNITTSTSVISTQLTDDGNPDDYFNDWHIIIRGTNNALVVRRVTDYTASSGTLVVSGANLAAEGGATNCELLKLHPETVRDAYNRARQDLFPQVGIVRDLQTIVTGQLNQHYVLPTTLRRGPERVEIGQRYSVAGLAENLLTNGGFEDWASTTSPNGWAVTGSGATMHQEEETNSPNNYMVLEGANSLRLHAATGVVSYIYQQPGVQALTTLPSVGMQGVEVNASAWVYCRTADRVSVAVNDQNGSSSGSTVGTKHTGNGWERLTASRVMSFDTTCCGILVYIDAGSPALDIFVDEAMLLAGPLEGPSQGWEPIHNWDWVPPVAGASDGGILYLRTKLPKQRRLRIVGRDMLSSVTSDTDTFEIDGELLTTLYDGMRQLLAEGQMHLGTMDEQNSWTARAVYYSRQVSAHVNRGRALPFAPRPIKIPDA
jgi:hypothetical protein